MEKVRAICSKPESNWMVFELKVMVGYKKLKGNPLHGKKTTTRKSLNTLIRVGFESCAEQDLR